MELTLDNVSLRLNRGKALPAMTAPAYNMPPMGMVQPGQMTSALQQTVSTEVPAEAQSQPEEKESPSADSAVPSGGTVVKAPIVGTFYASAAPDKPAYVKVGDTVAEGDTLCIIEAMKFMNEVPSEVSGTIAEIYVKDGEFVEYGQELFRIV